MKSFSRLAIAGAFAAFATTGVMAADLGGNCCADLEERIAELEATTARKGNRKQSLTVYGQVNTAIMWHNINIDGAPIDLPGRKNVSVLDNPTSQSRFGFRGSSDIGSGRSIGFHIEIAVGGLSDNNLDGRSTTGLSVRYGYAYLESKSMGTVYIGQASQATDGILQLNLGAPTNYTLGGNPAVFSATGLNSIGFFPVADIYGVQDGSRAQIVRYSTPTIGGFQLSGSTTGDEHDIALRYAGEFGGIRVAAGLGWRQDKDLFGTGTIALPVDNVDATTFGGSASIMHTPSGLYMAAMYARTEGNGVLSGADLTRWEGTLGIRKKVNTLGDTNLYTHYGEAELDIGGFSVPTVKKFGLGLELSIDAASATMYLTWTRTDVPIIDDVDEVMGGIKITF